MKIESIDRLFEYAYVITGSDAGYGRFCDYFQKAGLPLPKKFDGVYVSDQSVNETIKYDKYFNCSLAHLFLIKMAKMMKFPYVVVFEDDAVPSRDVKRVLAEAIQNIPQDAAMLKLGWQKKVGTDCSVYVDKKFCKLKTRGSHAYIVFENGYDFVKNILNSCIIIDMQAMNNDRTYCLNENLFIQYNGEEPSDGPRRGMYITKKKLTDYYKIDYRKYWIDSGMNISVEDLLKNSYVISMNDDKLDLMKTVFEKHGLAPFPKKWPATSFMHVTNGCAIEKHVNAANQNLLKAIGCSASHLSIIMAAKEMDLPFVCIFEDDAYPCYDIKNKLAYYLTDIPADTKCMILGNYKFVHNGKIGQKYFNMSAGSFQKIVRFMGSHAYIVFKAGYDDFIRISSQTDWVADNRIVIIDHSIEPVENLFIQYNTQQDRLTKSAGIGYLWNKKTPEQIFREFPPLEELLKDENNDNHN